MPSTFYMDTSGAYGGATLYGSWTITASVVRYKLSSTRVDVGLATRSYLDGNAALRSILLGQFWSPPLRGGATLTGSLQFTCRGWEYNALANMYPAISVTIRSGDGSTVRGAMWGSFLRRSIEYTTAATTKAGTATTAASIGIASGDRLVIEFGGSGDPGSGGSHNFYQMYGCSSTYSDHTLANNDAGNKNPWFSFNNDFAYLEEPFTRTISMSSGTTGFLRGVDSFDRADENPLASPWEQAGYAGGGLRVVSNQCQKVDPTTEADRAMHYTGLGSTSEQFSKITYVSGSDIGLLLRSMSTQAYQMNLTSDVCAIHQWTSGGGWSFGIVTQIPCVLSSGDNVCGEVTGTSGAATFALFLNGSCIGTRIYSSTPLVNGYPGVAMYSGDTPVVDDWSGGPIGVSTGWRWVFSEIISSITRTVSSSIQSSYVVARSFALMIRALASTLRIGSSVGALRTLLRSVSTALLRAFGAFRYQVFTRTLSSIVRQSSLASFSRWLIRTASVVIQRVFSVSRIGQYSRSVASSAVRAFSASRIGEYTRYVTTSGALQNLINRVNAYGRSALTTLSRSSLVTRRANYIRRATLAATGIFSVNRIGQYARTVLSAISSVISAGQHVVGGITYRTIAVAREAASSVNRIGQYYRTIFSSLVSVFDLSGLASLIYVRTLQMALATRAQVSRLRWIIRTPLTSIGRSFSASYAVSFVRNVLTSIASSFSASRTGQFSRTITTTVTSALSLARSVVELVKIWVATATSILRNLFTSSEKQALSHTESNKKLDEHSQNSAGGVSYSSTDKKLDDLRG